MSTIVEWKGFRATAEEVYATRTKEDEMVQELLKDWLKQAEVQKDDVI